MTKKKVNPITKAIRIAGGISQVARDLGIAQPHAVGKWIRKNKVPPYRVIPLEKLTGGDVTRHEIDPVLYPKD